jgi:hypothetical protein
LGVVGIVPEFGFARLGFEFAYFALFFSEVKDAP